MLFLIYDILDLWAGFITGITDNSNKYNKKAKITVNLVGIKQCKTDLQKTYHKAGCSCSLLTTESNSSFCIENCPLIPDKF